MRHPLAENSQDQRNAVNQLTESLTTDAPSGEPSTPVGPRQLVIFVVRAHQRPLSDLAELLVTPELEHGRLIVELRMDLSRLLKPLTTLG